MADFVNRQPIVLQEWGWIPSFHSFLEMTSFQKCGLSFAVIILSVICRLKIVSCVLSWKCILCEIYVGSLSLYFKSTFHLFFLLAFGCKAYLMITDLSKQTKLLDVGFWFLHIAYSSQVGLIKMGILIKHWIIWVKCSYACMFIYHFMPVLFYQEQTGSKNILKYICPVQYVSYMFHLDCHATVPAWSSQHASTHYDRICLRHSVICTSCQMYKMHPIVFSCQMSILNILHTAFACFLVLWFSHHKWWNTA